MARRNSGMGERLHWCQEARPADQVVGGRTVSRTTQKAVLWALTNRSDADGSCYPFQQTLADEACCGRQSANAALSALEAQGLISSSVDPENRRSRRYVLNLSHSATDAPAEPVASSDTWSDLRVGGLPEKPWGDVSHSATDHHGASAGDLSQEATPPVASGDTDLSRSATAYREPPTEPPLNHPSASAEGKTAGDAGTKSSNQILAEILLDSSSTAQHLLRGLIAIDESWAEIDNAVLVKLGTKYGGEAVTMALGDLKDERRGDVDPYPYLESVCVRVREERRLAVSA